MTTESPAAGQAARLEALRRRRAISPSESSPSGAAPPKRPPARRRHAAVGARIFVGGLSAAAAVGLVGVMAGSASSDNITSTDNVTLRPLVTQGPLWGSRVLVVSAPRPVPTAAAPITTSRGS